MAQEDASIHLHVKIMKRKEFDISISSKSTVAEVFAKIGEHFEDPIERLCFKGRFFRSPKDDTKTFLKGFKTATKSPKLPTIVGYPKKGVAKDAQKEKDKENSNDIKMGDKSSVDAAIKRQKSLEEIQAAAIKFAERSNDGFNWDSQYYFELSDQYGNPVRIPEASRKALTVAITLQTKADKKMDRYNHSVKNVNNKNKNNNNNNNNNDKNEKKENNDNSDNKEENQDTVITESKVNDSNDNSSNKDNNKEKEKEKNTEKEKEKEKESSNDTTMKDDSKDTTKDTTKGTDTDTNDNGNKSSNSNSSSNDNSNDSSNDNSNSNDNNISDDAKLAEQLQLQLEEELVPVEPEVEVDPSTYLDDALYLYHLAFESYSKVEQKWLDVVDNYGLCCLNIVWIYYLKKDEKHMQQAGQWLQIADVGLQRAYGKNKEKLIKSKRNGEFTPELAFYVRLNILRSLQALYRNELRKAQNFLDLAKMDARKLEISDLAIAQMQSMGFGFKESRRALRATQCDVGRACNYIQDKRLEKQRQAAQERERLRQRREQKRYGLTKSGKFVDLTLLNQLKGMSISTVLAVEALKQCDNSQTALDVVLDPSKKAALQSTIYSRAMRRQRQYDINQLLVLSHEKDEAKCRAALLLAWNKVDYAINLMLEDPPSTEMTEAWTIFIGYVAEKNAKIEKARKRREYERRLQQAMQNSVNNNNSNDNDVNLTTNENDNSNDANSNSNSNSNANKNDDGNNEDNKNESNADDTVMTGPNGANDNSGNDDNKNDNNNDNSNDNSGNKVKEDEKESKEMNASAFPNPDLGDTGNNNGNGDANLDNIDFVDDFQEIQRYNDDEMDRENAQIEQKILDDFEDDPDAYLDLDLHDEMEALTSLETMIASINAASMS